MEQRTATIPFDLETAKKINIGEIAGRIVTEKGQNRAEIVYEDNSSNCPLLVVIHSISVSADWFSATGKALSSENRLLLEVPERGRKGMDRVHRVRVWKAERDS